jgi:hypothetical protein
VKSAPSISLKLNFQAEKQSDVDNNDQKNDDKPNDSKVSPNPASIFKSSTPASSQGVGLFGNLFGSSQIGGNSVTSLFANRSDTPNLFSFSGSSQKTSSIFGGNNGSASLFGNASTKGKESIFSGLQEGNEDSGDSQ